MNPKKSLIYYLGKILGFEESYIEKINKDYQQGNDEERYEIMDILWRYFFQLYDKLTALKYAYFIKEVALGKRKLSSNIYQEAQEEIKTYFQKILTGEVEDKEKIIEIRKKILEMINQKNNF